MIKKKTIYLVKPQNFSTKKPALNKMGNLVVHDAKKSAVFEAKACKSQKPAQNKKVKFTCASFNNNPSQALKASSEKPSHARKPEFKKAKQAQKPQAKSLKKEVKPWVPAIHQKLLLTKTLDRKALKVLKKKKKEAQKTRSHHEKTFANKYALSLKINNSVVVSINHWQHQWKNLHFQYKSLMVQNLVYHFFLKRKLYLNQFFYHKYHGGLRLVGNTIGFYNSKLSKVFKKYTRRNHFFGKKIQSKKKQSFQRSRKSNTSLKAKNQHISQPKVLKEFLYNHQHKYKLNLMAKALLAYNATPKLFINFTHYYLPKTYIVNGAETAFFRFKSMQNFWHGLQLMRLIVENKAMAQMLARFVYLSVRRNPKRAAFIMHLKRIMDWHFAAAESLKIQGIRIEVKGRFNAKSRARKYILSVGRVAKQEKTSNVDYAFIEAITPFGCLAIKVWVCPEETKLQATKNVITTSQNKVSKSTQRAH
jgi:hypothetical protein